MIGMTEVDVYEYKRGTGAEWFVKCIVHNRDDITFADLKVPDDASSVLKEQFVEEAEKATLKQIDDTKRFNYD